MAGITGQIIAIAVSPPLVFPGKAGGMTRFTACGCGNMPVGGICYVVIDRDCHPVLGMAFNAAGSDPNRMVRPINKRKSISMVNGWVRS